MPITEIVTPLEEAPGKKIPEKDFVKELIGLAEAPPATSVPEPAPVAAEPPKAAEAPAPTPAPKGPSVSMEFRAGAETKTVEFTEGPLGMSMKGSMPMTVTGISGDGAADKAGVRPDWVFTKIAGEALDGLDYNAAMDKLKQATAPLPKTAPQEFPADAVVIEFADENRRTWKFAFTKKPLGMAFDNNMPVKVKSVVANSPAAGLGIKVGWTFNSIGGESVKGKDYKKILSTIQEQTAKLPST